MKRLCFLILLFSVGCGAQGPQITLERPVNQDSEALAAAVTAYYQAENVPALVAAVAAAGQAGPQSALYHEIAADLASLQQRDAASLQHLLAALRDPSGDNATLLLNRLTDLDWTFSERRKIDRAMDALRTQHPQEAVRSFAAWIRAHSAHLRADYAARDAALEQVALRLKPALIGPFDNDQGKGFDAEFPPEREIDLQKTYAGKLMDLTWRQDYAMDPRGKVDLRGTIYPSKWQVAYALSAVDARVASEYELRISTLGPIKVWVNDVLVYQNRRLSRWSFDGVVLPVSLRAGANRILIKSANRATDWLMVARLTTPGGGRPGDGLRAVAADTPFAPKGTPPCSACPLADIPPAVSEVGGPVRTALHQIRWLESLGLKSVRVGAAEMLAKAFPLSLHSRIHLMLALWDNGERGRTADLLSDVQTTFGDTLVALRMKQIRFWRQQKLNRKARALLVKVRDANPDLRAPYLVLARMFDVENRHAERCRILTDVNRRWPGWPTALYREADCQEDLRFYPRAQRLYETVLQELPNSRTAIRNLHWLHQGNDAFEQAERHAIALTTGWPHRLDSWKRLGETLRRTNDRAGATRAWTKMTQLSPLDPAGYTQLARLAIEAGEKDEAVRLWKAALQRNPNNEALINRVAWLAPERAGGWRLDAPDEAAINAVIASRGTVEVAPGANTVYLLDDEVTQLGADGSTSNIVTMVAHAVNQAGRDSLTKMSIRGGGRHRIQHAFAVGPDGVRVEASSIRGRSVRFRQLSVGSTVVLQYRISSRPDGYLAGHISRNWWFQGVGVQVHKARWVLWAPRETTLREQVLGAIQRSQSLREGDQVRVVWSGENLHPVVTEPGMPGLSEVAAHVSMSTVPTWEMFWKWEEALLIDAFRESPEVIALAASLIEGAKTTKEKVERIHAYLMQKIRYQQDYERSIAGVKPHAAPMVIARQYGDCKDKAVLFITLAKLAGVKVHFALVRTRNVGPVRREVPMQQFNHAIVYVPAQDGFPEGRFYDPTVDALDVDVLRHDDQGTLSLVFDPQGKTHTWREIGFQPAGLDVTTKTLLAQVQADGSLNGELELSAKGRIGEYLRKAARNPETLKQFLARRIVVGVVSSAKMLEHEAVDVTEVIKPAKIRLSLKAANAVRKEGRNLRMKLPIVWSPAAWFVLPERRYPLLLGTPRTESWSVDLAAPSGGTFQRAPSSTVIESECLHYSRKVDRKKTRLAVVQTVQIKCERIPVERYAEHRALGARIIRALDEEVVIRAPRNWVTAER